MESILCAAIYCATKEIFRGQPKNLDFGYVVCGYRHETCYRIVELIDDKTLHKIAIISGFLTSENRFVDRIEACEIAIKSGQIKEIEKKGTLLISEDLY